MLFSEPKIPQFVNAPLILADGAVSVLFSEPKIPQLLPTLIELATVGRFSALQRAENSSIATISNAPSIGRGFQCSSASRKFLNCPSNERVRLRLGGFSALQRAENSSIAFEDRAAVVAGRFSALQRAENSSIVGVWVADALVDKFQCSSASRKFLNLTRSAPPLPQSAFQCSSASRKFLNRDR